ncbi:sensor histidine kinase [Streptomyces sp. NBC_01435]|uniref:sensor histidine kinase n=1 Tax=Streptomyces sp. NBC_01435 TaxID=2903865 RepID=UPI002E2F1766|nr:sensor domain-containing protein [Streptomyces sp. NBC_01435]
MTDKSLPRARPTDTGLPRNPVRALGSPRLWLGSALLATDWVMALAGLAVLTLLGTGVLLLPVALTGIPLVMLAGWLLHRLADMERSRFAALCGQTITAQPAPELSRAPIRSTYSVLTSASTWQQVCYFTLLMPMSMLNVLVVSMVWTAPAMLALLPLYYAVLPSGRAAIGPLVVDDPGMALVVAAVAVVAGVTVSPLVVRVLTAADTAVARVLLAPTRDAQLNERVEHLRVSRARVVDAAEAERRRIERDLHDGAQQRLVAMAMTLGRASARLKSTEQSDTVELIESARSEARQAITELRDLTRGLHPPVLTDRGLDAALSAVAARSPVPVTIDVQVAPRPSATIEGIAYFVVCEALANVAKHAAASAAWVVIRRIDDRLSVTVGDNGIGGANPERGSGLRGLADRVAGVDGRLGVSSPVGGPTLIEVDFQCV